VTSLPINSFLWTLISWSFFFGVHSQCFDVAPAFTMHALHDVATCAPQPTTVILGSMIPLVSIATIAQPSRLVPSHPVLLVFCFQGR
jgi:hypothetical protein